MNFSNQWNTNFAIPGLGQQSLAPGLGQMKASDLFFSTSPTSPAVNVPTQTGPRLDTRVATDNLTKLTGWDKGRLAIGGLQTLGNLWMGLQANNMARKQFNFQRDFANANLAQSIKQYNTGLEDRLRSRAVTEGRDSGWADAEIARNRLSDTRVGGGR